MATEEQQKAHERSRRVLELMQSRAAAEANGEISAEAIDAAHQRNASFFDDAQALVDSATPSGRQKRPKALGL
ncbi:MAG: hypothetical protein WD598_01870 [Acidimicrobiia bacterium]